MINAFDGMRSLANCGGLMGRIFPAALKGTRPHSPKNDEACKDARDRVIARNRNANGKRGAGLTTGSPLELKGTEPLKRKPIERENGTSLRFPQAEQNANGTRR